MVVYGKRKMKSERERFGPGGKRRFFGEIVENVDVNDRASAALLYSPPSDLEVEQWEDDAAKDQVAAMMLATGQADGIEPVYYGSGGSGSALLGAGAGFLLFGPVGALLGLALGRRGAAADPVGDFAGFSLKKITKKVGKVAKSAVKAGVRMHTQPIRIAKDVKEKGLKKGLKAIPSRVFVDPIKDGNRVVSSTMRAVASKGTRFDALAGKINRSSNKLQTWTQKRPLQTTVGALVAVAGGWAAGAAIGAAGAAGGAAAAGGASAAGATTAAAGGAAAATTAAVTGGTAVAAGSGGVLASTAAFVSANAGTIGTVLSVAGAGAKMLTGGEEEVAPETIAAPVADPLAYPAATSAPGAGGGIGKLALPLGAAGAGFMVLGPIGALAGLAGGFLLSRKAA
jgi:hypothetical protein